MYLFVFAHRGEAQPFLGQHGFSPLSFPFSGLFKNSQGHLLLITGEGIQRTSERISAVCASFHHDIDLVVNMGVAGSLDSRLALGEIIAVRTSYLEPGWSAGFRSFSGHQSDQPSTFQLPYVDCISAHSRVTQASRADSLSCFAQVVDMELWAVGSVCHLFQIPFQAFKLLIDYAGQDVCQNHLQEQYSHYGDRINQFLSATFPCSQVPIPDNSRTDSQSDSQSDPHVSTPYWESGFYFTTAQRRQFQGLMNKLRIKYSCTEKEILDKVQWEKLKEAVPHPKKRTQKLLENLLILLSPFTNQVKKDLEQIMSPLRKNSCMLQLDCDWESTSLNLQIKMPGPKGDEAWKGFIKDLEQFPHQKAFQILHGEDEREGERESDYV